ncbi:hypothetical protein ABPG72_011732 [Tetrahymena utriculariae]
MNRDALNELAQQRLIKKQKKKKNKYQAIEKEFKNRRYQKKKEKFQLKFKIKQKQKKAKIKILIKIKQNNRIDKQMEAEESEILIQNPQKEVCNINMKEFVKFKAPEVVSKKKQQSRNYIPIQSILKQLTNHATK